MEDNNKNKDKIPVNYNEIVDKITDSVNKTVSSVTDYLSLKEEHTTERKRLDNLTTTIVAKIRQDSEDLQKNSEKIFGDRALQFVKLFEFLNSCLENNQIELAMQTLENIKSISKIDPIAQLSNLNKPSNKQNLLDQKEFNL